jgi:hypothetical protein
VTTNGIPGGPAGLDATIEGVSPIVLTRGSGVIVPAACDAGGMTGCPWPVRGLTTMVTGATAAGSVTTEGVGGAVAVTASAVTEAVVWAVAAEVDCELGDELVVAEGAAAGVGGVGVLTGRAECAVPVVGARRDAEEVDAVGAVGGGDVPRSVVDVAVAAEAGAVAAGVVASLLVACGAAVARPVDVEAGAAGVGAAGVVVADVAGVAGADVRSAEGVEGEGSPAEDGAPAEPASPPGTDVDPAEAAACGPSPAGGAASRGPGAGVDGPGRAAY